MQARTSYVRRNRAGPSGVLPSVNSIWHFFAQLLRFAWLQAQACAFAVALFSGLAASTVLHLPIPRYDALLIFAVAITVTFALLRWETPQEILIIFGFHLVGLAFELVKVRLGAWSYPEDAWAKVGGVPLYSGFMYAAVGSYVCRAWRLLDLRLDRYRSAPMVLVAAAIYANFVTHYWLPDLRWMLAGLLLLVALGTEVQFTVGNERYRMPLPLSFVLIGFFLWIAENVATFFGAWRYPNQQDGWQLVHVAKFGAWALLVSVSFVLVAAWQSHRGTLRVREPLPPNGWRWLIPVRRIPAT